MRTKYRQRRREKNSVTDQWNDDTQAKDTETLRHPFHNDMLMYYFLLVSDFRNSIAPPSSVTTTLRSGFVNFGRTMMSSLVHPLRYRWSGQKIHSLTLRVIHLNNCLYRRKKSHSIVRHWPWTGSHSLYFSSRSLSKVRLITWRRSWTRDWLGRSVSVKKKRRVVIKISVTEHDKETIISRRDYAAVFFLDMSRLKVDLWSVFN